MSLNGLPDAVDLSQVKRALVVKLRHHGDVLLTSPVFNVLKARAPHIEIDALVYADTQEMLSLHPAISTIHAVDRAWKQAGVVAQARAEWALWQRLKARRYDLLIHLTEHRRGMWLAKTLKPRIRVAPQLRNVTRCGRRASRISTSLRRAVTAGTRSNPTSTPCAASAFNLPKTKSRCC